jgi:hypothetical protein
VHGWPPWFRVLGPWAQQLPADGSAAERLNAVRAAEVAVSAGQRAGHRPPPRFAPPDAASPDVPYETYIARHGEVPTRDNAHDLLNGLVWLAHTPLKWRLNALQAQALDEQGVQQRRGPLRDALTVFDENGALWPDPDPLLLQAWQRRDWQALFVHHRARWEGQDVVVFGHALLDSLLNAPRKGLTAHVLIHPEPMALAAAGWAAKPFLPLPLCGIPGWWPGQDSPHFYEDPKVFRPLRNLNPPTGP